MKPKARSATQNTQKTLNLKPSLRNPTLKLYPNPRSLNPISWRLALLSERRGDEQDRWKTHPLFPPALSERTTTFGLAGFGASHSIHQHSCRARWLAVAIASGDACLPPRQRQSRVSENLQYFPPVIPGFPRIVQPLESRRRVSHPALRDRERRACTCIIRLVRVTPVQNANGDRTP